MLVHGADGVADDGERAVAEEVDLDETGVLGAVLLELNDGHRELGRAVEHLDRALQRHVVGERRRHDDHPAGMQGQVPRHADQRLRLARKALPRLRQVESLEVGVGGEQTVERLPLVIPGNAAGDLADFAGGPAVYLGHLAERAAEPETVVVGHHRRARKGIAAEHVRQHTVPLVPREVEVDVGRVGARGVEEPFEEEPGAEGLDVGNAEAVTHHRVGDGAATAVGGPVRHDVVDHQEVIGEALHSDDGQFVFQPVAGDGRHGAVAPFGAGVGERTELFEGVGTVGHSSAARPDRAEFATGSARRSPPRR